MLSGLLREENALPLVDRKRKKDAKDTRKRDGAAPPLDRIPLPAVPLSIIQERRHMQREAQKKLKISPNNPPSVCLYTILNAPNGVCSASFSENLEALAVGYGNSTIQLHALGIKSFRQLKPAEELETLDNDYEDISESMYDESTKNETIELNGHLGSVHSVNFSCDRRLLLSGSRDETVRLWNLDLRRNIVVYRMDAPVWDSQFCNRGMYFASATASKCVLLHSTERIHPLRIFTDASDDVTCLDFHPNCNFVAGGSDDNNVYMWDMLTGSCVQVFTGHKGLVHSVKISPDGRTLVSASNDGTLAIWDIGQQKLMAIQECAAMPFKVPIVFSRDSSVIAVGTPEHAVTFFNVDSVVTNFNASETRNNPDGFPMLSYPTKKTNFLDLHFSRKNTVVGVGVFDQ